MMKPELFVDWNSGGIEPETKREFVELYCRGTLEDIAKQKLVLAEGLEIHIYGDHLEASAVVGHLTGSANIFVAFIVPGSVTEK